MVENLEILNVKNHEEEEKKEMKEPNEEDILAIGVTLSKEERYTLSHPPKHSLNPTLSEVEFRTSLELCNTKIRYALRDEQGQDQTQQPTEDLDLSRESDLSLVIKEQEARSRVIFNQEDQTLDLRKRKVTDLQQNNKVYLPPPLNPSTEAGLAVRGTEYLDTFSNFCEQNCDSKGNQKANSNPTKLKVGLKSLGKRIKEGELTVLETDKTGKFGTMDRETYLRMGEKHNSGSRTHQP